VVADRRSQEGVFAMAPQHMVFLNDPDPDIWPSGSFGAVNAGSMELRRCDSTDYCIYVEATQPGQIDVLIDLSDDNNGGTTGSYDANSADVIIAEVIPNTPNASGNYSVCVDWDGRDGTGQLLDPGEVVDRMKIFFTQGVIHFPIFDAEFNVNGFTVENIRPEVPGGTSLPLFFWDDSEISSPPTDPNDVDPPDRPQTQLNGCQGNCRTWDYLSGSYPYGYGNVNTLNTWWFTNRSEVEITQVSIPDYVVIEIGEEMQFTCQGKPITLVGNVAYTSGNTVDCEWTGGTGTFTPDPTDPQATYTPSEDEYLAGSVDLTLAATGDCTPQARTVTYMFTEDFDICGQNLPVEWAYFQVTAEGDDGLLTWGTANELNTHFFEVERAEETGTFTPIGRVDAAGHATDLSRYQYRDKGVVLGASGTISYRLRQVDIDGQFDYSQIVELHLGEGAAASLSLYPNPARESVTLDVSLPFPDQPATLDVVDLQGRVVYQQPLARGQLSIQVSSWAAGAYFVRVQNGGRLLSQKLIVQ
ncbi:MAG: T9SS C-terminal target domain-containing protein, partial [Bacteroidetes bacterium]